jgi:hypothetical protein
MQADIDEVRFSGAQDRTLLHYKFSVNKLGISYMYS